MQKNEFKPNYPSTEVRGNREAAFVQRENLHLLLGTVKIACRFQKQHCQLLLRTLHLKENNCIVARLLRPKWSSSHPVSRITVILSVGNGPASRAHKALSFPTPPGRGRQPLLPYPCHGGWLGGGWGLWGWSLGSPFINQGEQPKAVTQGIWSQALSQACMPCLPLLATSTTTAPG